MGKKIHQFSLKQQKEPDIPDRLQMSYHLQQYCDLKYSEQKESLPNACVKVSHAKPNVSLFHI